MFDVILVIIAALALIAVVVYVVYSIDQGNRMRPPQFLRTFTFSPSNGCPGTIVTIEWETIDTFARTLTRRRPTAADNRTFVSPSGPITERVDETTTFLFEATKEGHPPITGSGIFTVFRDGATFDIDGLAACRSMQSPGGSTPIWEVNQAFDPSAWHVGLRVRSITLITTNPQHRHSLSVVHGGPAVQLTDAAPTHDFTDPLPAVQGNWQLFAPRLPEELCSPNDPGPGTYQPVSLAIRIIFTC